MNQPQEQESVRDRIARLRANRQQQIAGVSPSEPMEPDPKQDPASSSLSADSTIEDILEHRAARTQSLELNSSNPTTRSLQFDHSTKLVLNPEQAKAVSLAANGISFCLCGAAGTGKTTSTKEIIKALKEAPHTGFFNRDTKYIASGAPSIVVTAFTRRATKNVSEAIGDVSITTVNFHKLLQYVPVPVEILDPNTGEARKSLRFEPTFHTLNPLPKISTIIIEESSQFSIHLYNILIDALPDKGADTQFIFIGDIQQIPPTMGSSIYGEKLITLEGVELTRVYRQALESPIIRFLTDLRSGVPISRNSWKRYTRAYDTATDTIDQSIRDPHFRIGVFPESLDWEEALIQAGTFLRDEFHAGTYNPYNDMVLVPFNVKFGTIALNKYIAELLDAAENREVFEIIVGFRKKYLSIGDHILYETEDHVITGIKPNPRYYGTHPRPSSHYIDRSGAVTDQEKYAAETMTHSLILDTSVAPAAKGSEDSSNSLGSSALGSFSSEAELEAFVRNQMALNSSIDKTNQSSHIVEIESLDNPERGKIELSSLGDLDSIQLSYAITVHKAQGLQAPRVYFFLHKSHSPMHYRELVYTAASRAEKYLTIICDPAMLKRGAANQRIKGTTLNEKKAYFRAKYDEMLEKAEKEVAAINLIKEEARHESCDL